MAQPQPCPRCDALVANREKHGRDHGQVDRLEERIAELERAVQRHHPVEGRAEVSLHRTRA